MGKPKFKPRRSRRPIFISTNLSREKLNESASLLEIIDRALCLKLDDNPHRPATNASKSGKINKPSVFSLGAVSNALKSVESSTSSCKASVSACTRAVAAGPSNIPIKPEFDNARHPSNSKDYDVVYLTDSDDDIVDTDAVNEEQNYRIMKEFEAVNNLSSLQIHSNCVAKHMYSSLGEVVGDGKLYAFSKEPVVVNQVFRITASKKVSGAKLFVGFTARNPSSLEVSSLPGDSSQLLTRPDYWVFTSFNLNEANRIFMKIKNGGEVLVMFGEQEWRTFNIDHNNKLWFFVQAASGVQNVAMRTEISTYNYNRAVRPRRVRSGMNAGVPPGESEEEFKERAMAEIIYNFDWDSIQYLEINKNCLPGMDVYSSIGDANQRDQNAAIFAFSSHPVVDDQLYKIVATRHSNTGKTLLYLGFTSRNPASLEVKNLPYGDKLYERPDYWELTAFDLDEASRVYLKMKTGGEVLAMFGEHHWRSFTVSRESPLWLAIHAPKGVKSVKCHSGVAAYTYKRKTQRQSSQSTPSTASATSSPNRDGTRSRPNHSCIICYEPINSVLYDCGHGCMCFDCSNKVKNSSGQCPICRKGIVSVIRIY